MTIACRLHPGTVDQQQTGASAEKIGDLDDRGRLVAAKKAAIRH